MTDIACHKCGDRLVKLNSQWVGVEREGVDFFGTYHLIYKVNYGCPRRLHFWRGIGHTMVEVRERDAGSKSDTV